MARAIWSAAPPGGKLTTILTGLVGQLCAAALRHSAGPVMMASSAVASVRRVNRLFFLMLVSWEFGWGSFLNMLLQIQVFCSLGFFIQSTGCSVTGRAGAPCCSKAWSSA